MIVSIVRKLHATSEREIAKEKSPGHFSSKQKFPFTDKTRSLNPVIWIRVINFPRGRERGRGGGEGGGVQNARLLREFSRERLGFYGNVLFIARRVRAFSSSARRQILFDNFEASTIAKWRTGLPLFAGCLSRIWKFEAREAIPATRTEDSDQ